MNEKDIKKAAKEFAARWNGKGDEKSDTQKFWLDLLTNVLGVNSVDVLDMIDFEFRVKGDDNTSFGDAYIKDTKVLIEQKSINKNLRKAIRQGDGSLQTPFQQAKRYIVNLPVDEHPKYVITSNFQSILIYDMNQPHSEPDEILIKDLEKEAYRLNFIVKPKEAFLHKEMEVSIAAGDLVGLMYDAIYKEYKDPDEDALKSLNMLCVRLVFCMYAEDAGIFGKHNMFADYMSQFSAKQWRKALRELFVVLNTKIDDRDKYLEEELAAFPYVNGGLFEDENIEIPNFTDNIVDIILNKASKDFDWSQISPTIFGAVFESTLNPETRHAGGMHYTSIENIHKVIDPLFFDDLEYEFDSICKNEKTRSKKLKEFQEKLASIKFLDPAAGSGNFLTETYMSIRRLENKVLEILNNGQIGMGFDGVSPIKVHINQFYGIEINDFACSVAKTALWIAESQMMKETEEILHMNLEFLPLKTNANIVEGNSLRMDWEDVIPANKLSYCFGNPPFLGTKLQSKNQKKDMEIVFFNNKKYKKLDYVAAWYKKAVDYVKYQNVRCAFVSTNSICQGEMVDILWKQLFEEYNYKIDFAHKTFKWDSESGKKAAVHCVIVGFSYKGLKKRNKFIYQNERMQLCNNINAYLMDAPSVFIAKSQKSLSGLPEMIKGAQLIDDGNFVFESELDYLEFIKKEPLADKYIKRYYNARNLLNKKEKMYCLYLEECEPGELRAMKHVVERVQKVKEFRENSTAASVNKLQNTPSKYFISTVPKKRSIAIPIVSSERRKYIPLEIVDENSVFTNAINFIESDSMFLFGLLNSNVHNSWMRSFAGRLKSDYRYSKDLIYNTFPVPNVNLEQKRKIEKTAQSILDARALYPNSSLADLYDELTMPVELRKAHQTNDKAVMEAYGFWGKLNSESECVAELMKMYQKLTSK